MRAPCAFSITSRSCSASLPSLYSLSLDQPPPQFSLSHSHLCPISQSPWRLSLLGHRPASLPLRPDAILFPIGTRFAFSKPRPRFSSPSSRHCFLLSPFQSVMSSACFATCFEARPEWFPASDATSLVAAPLICYIFRLDIAIAAESIA